MKNKFVVIRDTREHKNKGWYFKESEFCQGMVEKKLDTGDYSIEGLEDILCIERKATVSEIAANLVDKRFDRELDRMESFKYKFLILEFSVDDIKSYPYGSDVPKKAWSSIRVKGDFMLKRLAEIQTKRDIHVVPCGDKFSAWSMAVSIMKRVNEIENV
tara:strand:+ start:29 stop:505 length:477 start_codon:yes stop_codon:yes gene_type:complete